MTAPVTEVEVVLGKFAGALSFLLIVTLPAVGFIFILAALSPAPLPDGPVPPAWPNTVTLVTGPGRPGASKLAKKLAATRRMIETVEVPLALPPVEPRRPWWRRKS